MLKIESGGSHSMRAPRNGMEPRLATRRCISVSLGTSRKYHALGIKAGKLGEFAQVLYILIVVSSDDFGRLPGDAFTVRHQVFPISPRSEADFERALQAMHDVGLIFLYHSQDNRYIQVVGFDEHQSGLHKRTKSRYPEPSEKDKQFREVPGSSGKIPEIPSEENRTEQKRREENKAYASSDKSSLSAEAPPLPIIVIPIIGGQYPVTQEQAAQFASLYPGIDVGQQLRSYLGWTIANPTRRKTQRGILRSINFWLAREQNQNGGRQTKQSPREEIEYEFHPPARERI